MTDAFVVPINYTRKYPDNDLSWNLYIEGQGKKLNNMKMTADIIDTQFADQTTKSDFLRCTSAFALDSCYSPTMRPQDVLVKVGENAWLSFKHDQFLDVSTLLR